MKLLSNSASESNLAQAVRLAGPTSTAPLTTVVGNAATAALKGGLYKISTDTTITMASGAAATANDQDLFANTSEYVFIDDGDTFNAFSAFAGGSVKVIRCP